MSDKRELDLIVPDPSKRIVSPRDAARIADENRKYGPGGKRQIPPADAMSSPISRDEAMTHVATATAEAVRLAMEEMDSALGDRLEQMEHVIFENVMRQIERRKPSYRIRMAVRAWLVDRGWVKPAQLAPVVDAVDVLDPNVQAAASSEPRLMWREFPKGLDGDTIKQIEALPLIAIVRKPGTTDWFVIAGSTANLKRACGDLGGENLDFEDGITSALLDLEFLERARAIIAKQDGT